MFFCTQNVGVQSSLLKTGQICLPFLSCWQQINCWSIANNIFDQCIKSGKISVTCFMPQLLDFKYRCIQPTINNDCSLKIKLAYLNSVALGPVCKWVSQIEADLSSAIHCVSIASESQLQKAKCSDILCSTRV